MIGYFVKHPTAANLILIAAVALGLATVPMMERETFPEFSSSTVAVSIAYPGASVADVDEEICQEVDVALAGISHLDEIECVSVDNLAKATLTMSEEGEIGAFYNDVASTVSSLELPQDAEQPVVSISGQTELIALMAISGIDNPGGLVRYADDLAIQLGGLSKISKATVTGISDEQLQIVFNQAELRRYGITARDVADAVEASSIVAPLGTVETRERNYTLRYSDARRNVADLEELIIVRNDTGGFVRLKDLGTVQWVSVTPEKQSTIDGQLAAIISIEKNKAEDAIEAFQEVSDFIDKERARLPEPFQIQVINNITEVIDERINLIVKNTLQGLVLVLAIMWLFFGFREAFWISMTLPISFLGGLFVLFSMGVTINMVSLLALLMSVGLIMDDSIVIADNIMKWRRTSSIKEAAHRGAIEVLPGVLSSFLTTACVFTPLMFLSGQMGAILQVIPIVLLITLSVSLVEAFLVLPNHLSHVSPDMNIQKERRASEVLEKFANNIVAPIVYKLVAWRYLTLGTIFAVVILSAGLFTAGTVKLIGFPTIEGDTVVARLALNPGVTFQRTQQTVDEVLSVLEDINVERIPLTEDGKPLVKRVLVQYAHNSNEKNNGPHTATITVDLSESSKRNIAADDLLDMWRSAIGKLPDLQQISFSQAAVGPGGSDIDVVVSASDAITVEKASNELFHRLQSRADVNETYLDFRKGRPEISVKLKSVGYAIGLTPQAVSDQLRAAFTGVETDNFRLGNSNIIVQVALDETIHSLSDLERFPITTPGGQQTYLTSIAEVELTPTFAQITRSNGMISARITGKIDQNLTTSSELSKIILDQLGPEINRTYPDVTFAIGGTAEDQAETQSSIGIALILGLIAVYMILAFQFRNYTLPVVVMLPVPFALVGTILGHLAFGIDLSMPSLIGFASLAGIVVNNSILFVTFFQNALKNTGYQQAAVEAVKRRFRPVVLSSFTTFIGLMPILLETSPQAQVLVPLVVAVAFGLLASTILVILVLPTALTIYCDIFAYEDRQEGENSRKLEQKAHG